MAAMDSLGLDVANLGDTLQTDGLRLFSESYDKLVEAVA